MEILREIINSDMLNPLFAVPKSMENMEVEVIVLPLADKKKKEVDVEAALKNITGIIWDEGMSSDDYRNERLFICVSSNGYLLYLKSSHNHARYTITRNVKDYEDSEAQPITPEAFLKSGYFFLVL